MKEKQKLEKIKISKQAKHAKSVFVLDTNRKPLDMCHPGMARRLLKNGCAAVFKRFPFTIILKAEHPEADTQDYQLKFDPGSKTTGVAVVKQNNSEVVFAAEIEHRGEFIKNRLEKRKGIRTSRRGRKTRYRKPRFLNRKNMVGKLPPSLMSRVYNVETWARRLTKVCPIKGISVEMAKFDTQLMKNPEIYGIEYQQGELQGYNVREYLLEKFNRACAYCNKKNLKLQVEHIIPRSRGGSNSVSNLTLACQPCNMKKGRQTAAEFGFPNIKTLAKKVFKDAGVMNSTRNFILKGLQSFNLPVEIGNGALTKFNRTKQRLPKEHWVDAACVGAATPVLRINLIKVLEIKAVGHGSRQMVRVDQYGFPRSRAKSRVKKIKGFQTGDIVKATVTSGKKKGIYVGKVAVRKSGYFNITSGKTTIQGINHKYFTLLHSCDGYSYSYLITEKNAIHSYLITEKNTIHPTPKDVGILAGEL